MPKVKMFYKIVDKETGSHEIFDEPIYVDAKGIFSCTMPEKYRPFAKTLVETKKYPTLEYYDSDYNKEAYKLRGKDLEELELALGSLVGTVARSALKRELVIMYRIDRHVTYAKDSDGNIIQRPPETGTKRRMKSDELYGVSMDNLGEALKSYNVGVYACVAHKTSQEGTAEVKYDIPMEDTLGNGVRHSMEFKLNNFLNLQYPADYRHGGVMWKDLKEMPYTEERETFFYDMMMAICKLADRISALDDHETVLQIADSGRNLLAGPKE